MNNFSLDDDQKQANLLKMLVEKSYRRGNFILASGKKSEHYLNCKPVSLSGSGLILISHLFLN